MPRLSIWSNVSSLRKLRKAMIGCSWGSTYSGEPDQSTVLRLSFIWIVNRNNSFMHEIKHYLPGPKDPIEGLEGLVSNWIRRADEHARTSGIEFELRVSAESNGVRIAAVGDSLGDPYMASGGSFSNQGSGEELLQAYKRTLNLQERDHLIEGDRILVETARGPIEVRVTENPDNSLTIKRA